MGSFTSGSHIGSYQILSPLGAGGMGEVYRARDTMLKRIHRRLGCNANAHSELVRTAEIRLEDCDEDEIRDRNRDSGSGVCRAARRAPFLRGGV
jgi:serine/threonine protein kinase